MNADKKGRDRERAKARRMTRRREAEAHLLLFLRVCFRAFVLSRSLPSSPHPRSSAFICGSKSLRDELARVPDRQLLQPLIAHQLAHARQPGHAHGDRLGVVRVAAEHEVLAVEQKTLGTS